MPVVVDPTQGLSEDEVAARTADGRTNDVPTSPTRTTAQIVRANLFTRFNALLGAMLAVILVVGEFRDALFGMVLVANTAIGIVQELRAKRTLDRLRVLTAPTVRVIRAGQVREIHADGIVLDDVVEASSGSQIVVDGEVLRSEGMEVDESLLTGESDPARKREGDEVRSGSFVVAGAGRFRATAVGADAYAVRLAEEARRFTLVGSELRSGIDRILRYVTWAIVPTAILLFWSQVREHDSWEEAASRAVAGTVAMVPEGLVLLTSIAFAAAVVRLARRNVLTQELQAVEALARVDVLCVDKTGTLTEGKLAVDRVEPLADIDPAPALAAIAHHDPAPNATMRAIAASVPDAPDWIAEHTVAFSSARAWSAVGFGAHGAWYLGAPDALLPPGAVRAEFEARAAAGIRVVALARAASTDGDRVPADLEPIAAVILADRVRPSAGDTLRYFAEQGVTVKVLSGDHPAAVGTIASSLGLEGADEPMDARTVDDHDLGGSIETHSVFGRVSPHRKREMVHALQAAGHTVAMTGDGVNDVLALKDADIGIAMGEGSDATRAVAQLVLLDSTFDALPEVVAEGRRVLGNIERTSGLYLTKTVYAMLIALATGVLTFAFPFLPRHLSLIGAFTIGIPSFFLALAPGGERFRPGFVHRVLRFAIPAGALAGIATLFAYGMSVHVAGVGQTQAQTSAVLTLTWVGFAVLTIVASPLDGRRLALIWGLAAGFVAVLAFPATRTFFALDLPPLVVGLADIGIAAIVWSFARLFVPEERPIGRRRRPG
jgi:cation-transporting ATPase E